jgi:hypothetical protein
MRERAADVLRDQLRDKKDLAVVDARSQAAVTVQVWSAASTFSPMANNAHYDPNAIPVDVTAAGRTTRITVSHMGEERTLHQLASRIDRWVRENRAAILGRPPAGR